MGFYLDDGGPGKGRAQRLIEEHGAVEIPPPMGFVPHPGKALICVVENEHFDAAGICYDEREWELFQPRTEPIDTEAVSKLLGGAAVLLMDPREAEEGDNRPRTWLLIDEAEAIALCPRWGEWKGRERV